MATIYKEYLDHQASKLPANIGWIRATNAKYREALRERLRYHDFIEPRMSVLCLGARLGGEVRAFQDLGCFAVGIDINPGPRNEWVLYGDFHDIQFPDGSADLVFTNSLDHSLNLARLIKEIRRVLRPLGFLILEVVGGMDVGWVPDEWDCSVWKNVDEVLARFDKDFRVDARTPIDFPWKGEHIVMVRYITEVYGQDG